MMRDNLKKLMALHGNLTVSELARVTNVPQPTLHHILSGLTKNPRRSSLNALACYFQITVNQLIGTEPLPKQIPLIAKMQLAVNTVPIYDSGTLGDWPNCKIESEIIYGIHETDVSSYFALTMSDESMSPLFPKGCLLIFDPKKTPHDRDYVLVQRAQSKDFAFRKLLMDGNNSFIKSCNNEFNELDVKALTGKDKVIAVLVESRLKF